MTKVSIHLQQGHVKKEEPIVGIDLGTTNSLIAIVDKNARKPIILKEENKASLVPSVVFIDDENRIIVGEEAKKKAVAFPLQTISSVKRLMGKNYKDIENTIDNYRYKIIDDNKDGLVRIDVNGLFYTPIELSSFILKELKRSAERALGEDIRKAVITVPAYYNDTQRQAVKDAGRLAGLDVLRIINEPTAASLSYGLGLDRNAKKNIAVYDLGGGTFDISILRISGFIFEVLATKGDTYLGGDDIDILISKHWIETYRLAHSAGDLKTLAEEAKKKLSTQDVFTDKIDGISIELNIETLKAISRSFVKKTIDICEQALKDAQLSKQEIDEVLLVGGSTRMPIIKEAVGAFFEKKANDSQNPDEAVALGAAIQADVLAGKNKDVLLLDVIPLSLGIETAGGLMDILIPRNTTIPYKATRIYSTQKDGQSAMRISIYQGERDIATDNRKLSEFILKGIPPMPAGMPKVEIAFLIDADGILTVKAKEQKSGISQEIEIKSQYGLDDKEIERLLESSIAHAKEDMRRRAIIEARTEAETLLRIAVQFISRNKESIKEKDIKAAEHAIWQLQDRLTNTPEDKDKIYQAIDDLNAIAIPFAEDIMNKSAQEALQGKKIKD